MAVPTVEESVCKAEASAVMLTVSEVWPTSIFASTRTRSPATSVSSLTMKPLKPAASTRTEYRPIGNRLKTYSPELSVVAARTLFVPRLVMVTLALGSTPPELSVTVPTTSEVVICANAVAAPNSEKDAARTVKNAASFMPAPMELTLEKGYTSDSCGQDARRDEHTSN